jgi:hypothetical protein
MLRDDLPSLWRASITARSSSVSSRPLGIISVIECIEVKCNCDRVYTFSVILSDVYITVKAIVILSLDFYFSFTAACCEGANRYTTRRFFKFFSTDRPVKEKSNDNITIALTVI